MIKVLLVDDEHHVISHMTNLLQRLDSYEINVINATSGSEAMQLISSTHIDIAFLDINMPKISGLQLADKLHNQWPDCQIVFLTAYEEFGYIYKANQYPGAIYLLKAEPDQKILDVASSCCRAILEKRAAFNYMNDIQKKEKLLLLLQEQQLLHEVVHGNLTGDFERFVKNSSLEIHFSFSQKVYLMTMHILRSPSTIYDKSFYLEKMEHLLGKLFHFSFVETEKSVFLWIFQEKDNLGQELSYFDCLKDTMDSFLDICTNLKHQTLSLCLFDKKVSWNEISRSYQYLYDSNYNTSFSNTFQSSIVRVIKHTEDNNSIFDIKSNSEQYAKPDIQASTIALSNCLSTMKLALYQGNQDLFFEEFAHCRGYCITVKSMHHVGTLKIYFSIVLIYLDYIAHYKLESKISMQTAIYPLYFINDFPDWAHAFSYLRQIGEVIFKLVTENNNDKAGQLIASIQTYIQKHLSDDLNLTVIANHVNYNESHISRLFKRYTGTNLSEHIISCRIDYAKKLLTQTDDTIQVISQKTGFSTSQYFSSTFRKSTGMSPNEYRLHEKKS